MGMGGVTTKRWELNDSGRHSDGDADCRLQIAAQRMRDLSNNNVAKKNSLSTETHASSMQTAATPSFTAFFLVPVCCWFWLKTGECVVLCVVDGPLSPFLAVIAVSDALIAGAAGSH